MPTGTAVRTCRCSTPGRDGVLDFTVPMRSNDMTLLTLEPVKP
ncbi:hypothetical protein [Ideonella sp.]|nr:hypothetical protein [Ideonella sp.]HJV69345.1 hypothetical protein [Ideonella sp.]